MKKFLEGLVCFVGVIVIVGSIGSMEQEFIGVGEAVKRIFQGAFIIGVSRALKMLKKRAKSRTGESEKVIVLKFRKSA